MKLHANIQIVDTDGNVYSQESFALPVTMQELATLEGVNTAHFGVHRMLEYTLRPQIGDLPRKLVAHLTRIIPKAQAILDDKASSATKKVEEVEKVESNPDFLSVSEYFALRDKLQRHKEAADKLQGNEMADLIVEVSEARKKAADAPPQQFD